MLFYNTPLYYYNKLFTNLQLALMSRYGQFESNYGKRFLNHSLFYVFLKPLSIKNSKRSNDKYLKGE